MNELTTTSNSVFQAQDGFESAQRMAKALVSSDLVPKQYRGNENMGNALIALEMSQRLNASVLMTMQNLYSVHGTPSWSSKFKIASFNQCGRFTAIRYRWQGKEGADDYGCQAYATEKATGAEIEGPWITWELVKKEGWINRNGSKWINMPQKMFMYRAASWMIDLYAPEICMGLPTVEEANEIIDINPETGEILSETKTYSLAEKLKEKLEPAENDGVPK